MISLALLLCLWPQSPEDTRIDRRVEARDAFRARPEGLYRHYCAHCHGDDARGSGRLWSADLSPAPPDLAATGLDAAALAAHIRGGSAARGRSPLCPPWEGNLSALEIDRLSRHLDGLGGRSGAPAAESSAVMVDESFPWWPLAVVLIEAGALAWWWGARRRPVRGGGPAPES